MKAEKIKSKIGLEDLRHYLQPEDMEQVAKITELSIRTIRRIVWGHTQRSIAIPYLIELAEVRKQAVRNKLEVKN